MTGKVTTSAHHHGFDPPGPPSYTTKKSRGGVAMRTHRAAYPGRPLGDSHPLAALSHRPQQVSRPVQAADRKGAQSQDCPQRFPPDHLAPYRRSCGGVHGAG